MSDHIQIDFVKPAWYSLRYCSVKGVSLFMCGIFFALGLYGYQRLHALQVPMASKLAAPSTAIVEVIAEPTPIEPILTNAQTQVLTSLASQLNMPWNDLLVALENLPSQDIALVSIEPNGHKKQLQLTGEARNLPAMLAYVAALETMPMLAHVILQKHQINEAHPYQSVEFMITANWQS